MALAGVPRFLLTSSLHDPLPLVCVQSLHGLQVGVYWLAATTLFATHAPPSLRHTAQALLPATMFGAGPLLGLLLGATVLSRSNTDALYLVMAAISAVACLLVFVSRPQPSPAP